MNWRRALQRGIGMCSEQSIVLSGLLTEHQIQAGIIGMGRHVVSKARVQDAPEKWWILDPDYGVVIPYSPTEVKANPNLVRSYYLDAGYGVDLAEDMVKLHGGEGNIEFDRVEQYAPRREKIEKVSYLLIWIIPFLIMLPYILRISKKSLLMPGRIGYRWMGKQMQRVGLF